MSTSTPVAEPTASQPTPAPEEVREIVRARCAKNGLRLAENVQQLREGKWNKGEFSNAQGIKGRRIGLVGFGSIAKAVAKRRQRMRQQRVIAVIGPGAQVSSDLDAVAVTGGHLGAGLGVPFELTRRGAITITTSKPSGPLSVQASIATPSRGMASTNSTKPPCVLL